MIIQPFKNYPGSKNGNGVFQTIINNIPDCDISLDQSPGSADQLPDSADQLPGSAAIFPGQHLGPVFHPGRSLKNSGKELLPERSYCTCCKRKFYKKDLIEIHYKLLKKNALHCQKCMSAFVDNLQYKIGKKEPYLLELFSGSKTVSNTAESFGFKTFSIDIENKFSPSLVQDISKLSLKQIPEREKIMIVWASVPCTYYSILNLLPHWKKLTYAHRKYYYVPVSKEAFNSIRLLEKTLFLIKKINPIYFFIENPRGALRHMPQISSVPFMHSISYSDYGMDVYKPTDIFTNCSFLKLHKIKREPGKIFENQITDMNSSFERSIVPALLIESIITQIKNYHKW